MNIAQLKLWSWTGAGVLTLGLSWFVYDSLKHYKELQAPIDEKVVLDVLERLPPKKAIEGDRPNYTTLKRLFHETNWTGELKQEVLPQQPNLVDQKPILVPLRELIKVTYVCFDAGNPQNSTICIRYKPKAGVASSGPIGGVTMKEGVHLAVPHDKVILKSIQADGGLFEFEGTEREPEAVSTDKYDAKTAMLEVGPGGVLVPKIASGMQATDKPASKPGKTMSIGLNHYALGQVDMDEFEKDYARILAEQLKSRQHTDPKTGRYDGVEITEVSPGSLLEQHGAQVGDIVKSINGHAVNSVAEAINFVKMNSSKYSTWEVVIENHGKTRTVTYDSPNH